MNPTYRCRACDCALDNAAVLRRSDSDPVGRVAERAGRGGNASPRHQHFALPPRGFWREQFQASGGRGGALFATYELEDEPCRD